MDFFLALIIFFAISLLSYFIYFKLLCKLHLKEKILEFDAHNSGPIYEFIKVILKIVTMFILPLTIICIMFSVPFELTKNGLFEGLSLMGLELLLCVVYCIILDINDN